jgi:hypothetical protein
MRVYPKSVGSHLEETPKPCILKMTVALSVLYPHQFILTDRYSLDVIGLLFCDFCGNAILSAQEEK